ncbi:MAG: AsmA family protein, partial [Sedimentisphaerales bacterium]
MAKQKNTWLGVLFIIIVALVFLVIISPFIIDSVLKVGIEQAIKKQLNVDASVSRVHLSIGSGSIEVNDLKIGNPPGYEFERILELKSIGITANVRSLFSDTVEVNQVSINDITIVMEQK